MVIWYSVNGSVPMPSNELDAYITDLLNESSIDAADIRIAVHPEVEMGGE